MEVQGGVRGWVFVCVIVPCARCGRERSGRTGRSGSADGDDVVTKGGTRSTVPRAAGAGTSSRAGVVE